MKGRNGYTKKGGRWGAAKVFVTMVQMFLSRTGTVHEPEGEDLVWRRLVAHFNRLRQSCIT